jgi:cyclase
MKYKSIIPRLDLKGPNLIKTLYLEGLRVLGKPEEYAEQYYKDGCDELIVHDVAAQLLNKLVSLDSIKKISKNIFVPIVVSGGIRSIEDIKKILENGGSKVSINSNALANPEFINKVVNIFGSSVVSVSIDVGKINSKYYAFSVGGRECSGKDPVNWAKEAEERGAGEIILTSIENEGAGKGYNLDLIKKISSSVGIRVIANGGVGNIDNIFDLFDKTKAGAASMASILHYSLLKKNNKFRGYDEEGSHAFLMKKNFNFKKFENFFIQDIKDKLKKKNINIR